MQVHRDELGRSADGIFDRNRRTRSMSNYKDAISAEQRQWDGRGNRSVHRPYRKRSEPPNSDAELDRCGVGPRLCALF